MNLSRILISALMSIALLSAQAPAPPPPAKTAAKKAAPATADQCMAKTKAGDQCKRKASAGSKFCWQHGGKKAAKKA
ncbi:MAG: hypothetical protein HY820_05025 [Acidobacteria bacterium]|nr:hypothetical protein [Acidobacteriota bacterium]